MAEADPRDYIRDEETKEKVDGPTITKQLGQQHSGSGGAQHHREDCAHPGSEQHAASREHVCPACRRGGGAQHHQKDGAAQGRGSEDHVESCEHVWPALS